MRTIKLFLLSLMLLSWLTGQSVSVSLNSTFADVNQLSLNDFDLLGAGSTTIFFGGDIILSGAKSGNFKLTLKVIRNGKTIVSGSSKEVTIIKDQTIRFDNISLAKGLNILDTNNVKIGLSFDKVEIDDALFGSGLGINASLPEGNFTIRLEVNWAGANGSDDFSINIKNNWNLDLLMPADGSILSTATPTFQWLFNDPSTQISSIGATSTLYVYKFEGTDIQSALSKSPILQVDVSSVNNFIFPSANSRALEEGQSYIWTVRVSIKRVSGNVELPNKFFIFKYEKNADPNANLFDETLKQLFGKMYNKVKNDLNGYKLKSAKLNGTDITINALSKLADDVNSGRKKILVEF